MEEGKGFLRWVKEKGTDFLGERWGEDGGDNLSGVRGGVMEEGQTLWGQR